MNQQILKGMLKQYPADFSIKLICRVPTAFLVQDTFGPVIHFCTLSVHYNTVLQLALYRGAGRPSCPLLPPLCPSASPLCLISNPYIKTYILVKISLKSDK
ncbi:MAG: hypothetical protein N0E45_16075, partial [Candidatus Thiodiazotropha endolucinida]|nr:hypothetical protein [Candidatus Thiodiazotropha taylori]MCW4301153.1 hypothetical protein [Candidatus Thiodiazotropha endolucinida]